MYLLRMFAQMNVSDACFWHLFETNTHDPVDEPFATLDPLSDPPSPVPDVEVAEPDSG
jgi:hypothetical protein